MTWALLCMMWVVIQLTVGLPLEQITDGPRKQ